MAIQAWGFKKINLRASGGEISHLTLVPSSPSGLLHLAHLLLDPLFAWRPRTWTE